ncbi:CACTA en-spm transposon protein [Cucumis melo var. makuwa]|uniref:CACTA en-spm transposon protein n=1 Tax=Cucumis melo var. makuwa TaxID=1194695 RepID=A0A5D3DYP8_CUCMM|nr:CACTA en-spm transposon protein [Cucumis melo var. makuwa]TYK28836.1 CACTA en-spm transposon protein [Cucumis melo var. makuwa]
MCVVSTLRVERYVAANGQISMMITPGTEKPIFPHVVRFSQAIGMCVRKTFVCCLKWADIGREYIEVVKGDLRFVEHQMLNTFKKFWDDCHKHFKKYNNHTYWWDVMRIDIFFVTNT